MKPKKITLSPELLDVLVLAATLTDEHYDRMEADVRKFKNICYEYLPQQGEGYMQNKNVFDITDKTVRDIQAKKTQARKLIMELINSQRP